MPTLEINGRFIDVQDAGGDGPPLVLLPGFLFDTTAVAPQASALSDVYRVIAFDTVTSGRLAQDGQRQTLWDVADDVFAVLDQLGIERAVLGGAGIGGGIALRAALRHPDRVRALVLMGTTATGMSETAVAELNPALQAWVTEGPSDALLATLADRLVVAPEQTATWISRWRDLPPAGIAAAAQTALERDDVTHRLVELPMPILLVRGTQDPDATTVDTSEIAAAVDDCRGVIELPGGGPLAHITHAEIVTPAIRDFLESLPA